VVHFPAVFSQRSLWLGRVFGVPPKAISDLLLSGLVITAPQCEALFGVLDRESSTMIS